VTISIKQNAHSTSIRPFINSFILYVYDFFALFQQVISGFCDGQPVTRALWTPFRRNANYFRIYKTLCYFIFRSVGPLVTLIALNFRLVRALQVVSRKRRELAVRRPRRNGGKQRESLTLILVTVVTVFIVCQIPDVGIRIAYTLKEFAPRSITLDLWTLRYGLAASNALLTVNSSVNFLIYCLVGKKFRRILANLCCPTCRHSPAEVVQDTSFGETTTRLLLKRRRTSLPDLSETELVTGTFNTAVGPIVNGRHAGLNLAAVRTAGHSKQTVTENL
jgi:hypothetical protein